jgi:diacylglycerol kinase
MRLIKSFGYAFQGVKYCFYNEKNFRVQIYTAAITFASGLYFKISKHEWLIILIFSALVLSLEMINTTIEKLSNEVCQSINPVIKQVKDIAAGAVFVSSVMSFIAGIIIFLPKIKWLIIK